jgi:class 3 adenylate cyclase
MDYNPNSKEKESFLINLHQTIFNQWTSRDPEAFQEFIDLFDPQLAGINAGVHELFDNRDEFVNFMRQEQEEVPKPPVIDIHWLKARSYGSFGVSWAQFNMGIFVGEHLHQMENLRMSLIWNNQKDGWKVVHAHTSLPAANLQEDETFPIEELKQRNEQLEKLIAQKTEDLKKEKEKTESLLHNILPIEIAKELLDTGAVKPARFEEVSILFTDFKEFTNIVATIPTRKLISELNELFSEFDDIMESEGIEKIQTVGDAYLAASGLPEEQPDHAIRCVRAGKKMIDFLKQRNETSAIKWKIRIGIHSGPIAAGVVGKKKFAYDIFGDTINIASRIETAGEAGKINVSAYTYDLIKDQFPCEYRGKISAKGKGDLDMYFVK